MEYRILQFVGAFVPGDVVPAEKFPAGTEFDRLIGLKAIESVKAAPAQEPANVAALRKQITTYQSQLSEANATITRLTAEISALKVATTQPEA